MDQINSEYGHFLGSVVSGEKSLKVIFTEQLLTKGTIFAVLMYSHYGHPDISSSSKNINVTARVSRHLSVSYYYDQKLEDYFMRKSSNSLN